MTAQSDALEIQLLAELARVPKDLALEIAAELRKPPGQGGTPVDTGHARANWIVSIGEPPSEQSAASGAAYQNGVTRLLSWKLGDGDIFVGNAVVYIQRLDAGHSKQAPAGFIEAAIARAVATVQTRYQILTITIDPSGSSTSVDLSASGGVA